MRNEYWYDEECKKLLTDKRVLLNILKREVEEYEGLSDDEILSLICEPQMAVIDSDAPLESRNVVDQSIKGERIEYDVLLYAKLPKSKEKVGLIINLEVQSSEPNYPIIKRGIYYLNRLLARQDGSEIGFQQPHYEKLKKVMGIWICRMKEKGVLNNYEVNEKVRGTDVRFPKEDYDLLKLIIVSPNQEDDKEIGTVNFLSLLFGEHIDAEEFAERMEKDYGIKWDKERKEEIMAAKGWGHSIYESAMESGMRKGMEKGIEKGILGTTRAIKMMRQGISDEQIMKETEISISQLAEIRDLIISPVLMVAEKKSAE